MKTLYHTRLFASEEDGQTHFEDVPIDLERESLTPHAEERLPCSRAMRAETLSWTDAPLDWSTQPRSTCGRRIWVTLKGEYQVRVSDGETRNFPVGSVLLLDDVQNGMPHPLAGHSTKVISPEGVTLLTIGLRSRSHPHFGDGD
jgi:hypothetical protein